MNGWMTEAALTRFNRERTKWLQQKQRSESPLLPPPRHDDHVPGRGI